MGEFREAIADKVRSARHRGGAFLGLSVQLVSGRGVGLGDFEGVADDETMGNIVNGNRGIMRVLVNLDAAEDGKDAKSVEETGVLTEPVQCAGRTMQGKKVQPLKPALPRTLPPKVSLSCAGSSFLLKFKRH